MTFATAKENQTSDKFTLVRIKPARFMNPYLVLNGGVYEATVDLIITQVSANGVALTKVNGTPAANEWSYNETTKLLRVNSTPSSANAIVAYYFIFLTGDKFRVTYENPEDSATALRNWEPKLKKFPSFNQSILNVVDGKLTLNSSSVEIIQDNNDFMKYLGDDDSFYQKEIKAWFCLDDLSNIKKAFEGKITEVKTNRNSVSLRVEDNLGILDQPLLFGDISSETYFNKSDYANLDPTKNGSLRRFIFGTVSRYQAINTSVATYTKAQSLDCESLNEAVNYNYNEQLSTTVNRNWGICRTKDGFLDFSFSPSAVDNTNANHTEISGTSGQINKFHIGDTFIANVGGTDFYARVLYVDRSLNKLIIVKNASITFPCSVLANDCPSIVIRDSSTQTQYYPLYGRDYTTTVTTSTGGNKILNITFTNNFEATLSMPTLNPSTMKVGYRVKPDATNANHADVLKFILQSVGVSCDSTTFSAAKTAMAVNANFSVPYFDESDYSPVYKYTQEILKSTLSFIALDSSFNVIYKLLSTPSSTSEITNTEILDGTFDIKFNYKDIITQIISYNPHYASVEAIGASATSDKSNKSRWLHGIDKTTQFRHVLENMTTRIANHIALKAEREALYSFDTKTKNLDTILGDDFLLKNNSLPSNAASRSVKVLDLSKSSNGVTVTASDLYNL